MVDVLKPVPGRFVGRHFTNDIELATTGYRQRARDKWQAVSGERQVVFVQWDTRQLIMAFLLKQH